MYAADIGGYGNVPMAYTDSKFDIKFVFLRNNRKAYTATSSDYAYQSYIITQTDNYLHNWLGHDITIAVEQASRLERDFVEMFYSPTVYRAPARYNLGERMRHAMEHNVNATVLLSTYRQILGAKFDASPPRANKKRSQRVFLDFYFTAIRSAAMIEWITLKHVLSRVNSPNKKLIENNFGTLLADLRHEMDEEVYEAVEKMYWLSGRRKMTDAVRRDERIDHWLVEVASKSGTALAFLEHLDVDEYETERNEDAKTNQQNFEDIYSSLLQTKFHSKQNTIDDIYMTIYNSY